MVSDAFRRSQFALHLAPSSAHQPSNPFPSRFSTMMAGPERWPSRHVRRMKTDSAPPVNRPPRVFVAAAQAGAGLLQVKIAVGRAAIRPGEIARHRRLGECFAPRAEFHQLAVRGVAEVGLDRHPDPLSSGRFGEREALLVGHGLQRDRHHRREPGRRRCLGHRHLDVLGAARLTSRPTRCRTRPREAPIAPGATTRSQTGPPHPARTTSPWPDSRR